MDGLSVYSQVDRTQFFSISTIDPEQMKKHGLNMSISQLKTLARNHPWAKEIRTGSSTNERRQCWTKIYRYDDFKNFNYKNVGG